MRLSCPHCQCYLLDHSIKGWKRCNGCAYRTDGRPERDVVDIEKLEPVIARAELHEYLDEYLERLFGVFND